MSCAANGSAANWLLGRMVAVNSGKVYFQVNILSAWNVDVVERTRDHWERLRLMSLERCSPLMCILVYYISCVSPIASAIDMVPVTTDGSVLLTCRIVNWGYRRKVRSVVICNRASKICILGLVIPRRHHLRGWRVTGPFAIVGRMGWLDGVVSVRI